MSFGSFFKNILPNHIIPTSGLGGTVTQATGLAAPIGIGMMTGNPMAGVGVAASMFSAQQQAQAQRDANTMNWNIAQSQMGFSASQAKAQMDFQREMSNTSVQRMVADMNKAGINPMLAAGAGESTPGGAMGSSAGATMQPIPSVFANTLSTAKDLLNTYSSFKSSMATADAARASAVKAGVETDIMRNKKPEAQLEGKFFGWLNGFVDKLSHFSAKQLFTGDGSKTLDNTGGW